MRSRCTMALLALGLVLATVPAHAQAHAQTPAQTWPTKPLRAIVPIAPGTITDVLPRIVFEQLASQLGQSIIVENRPGAGTTIAASLAAKAEPDGYTLFANSSAHTIAPALYPDLSYHPARDFAAVASLGILPAALVVSPAKGFKSVADFVAAARTRPGAMTFGSAGVGTATHLSAMRFQVSAGMQAVHVPFKGGPEIISEIIAGRIDFFLAPVANALPFVRDGKLAALVVNSNTRSTVLPEVPTTAEAGLVNAEYLFWIGLFVPAKTPPAIIDRLSREIRTALAMPKVREKLVALGVDPMDMTPKEFDAYVEKQIAADAELVKAAGIKAQ